MPAPNPPRDPWFLLPVATALLLDAGFTLAMQPAAYWTDPSKLEEANATWAILLRHGPLAFGFGFTLYGLLIAGLLLWLRDVAQKLLGMFILLNHTYGAASWAHLKPADDRYWAVLMTVLLIEAIAFAVYWSLSPWRHRPTV